MSNQFQSISLGLLTIFCWASLATFGHLLVHLPPFYVLGASFLLGGLPALIKPKEIFPSLKITLWGISGYFLYHFFLFYSFRFIPTIEANLINYLCPTFMVLFSALVFKQRLYWYHWIGAGLALFGCFILSQSGVGEVQGKSWVGYLFAFLAALIWPIYSIGRRVMGGGTLASIGGLCFGTSFLCFMIHFMIEPRVVLQWSDAWKILLMGLGPFGIGFYTWDIAMKKGDPKILGSLSYLTPALSTTNLIIFGGQVPSIETFYAIFLILGGTALGLLDLLRSRR